MRKRYALVGLGPLGGSLARDLAGRGARVLGHDTDPEMLRAALASGAVQAPLEGMLAVPMQELQADLRSGACQPASSHIQ